MTQKSAALLLSTLAAASALIVTPAAHAGNTSAPSCPLSFPNTTPTACPITPAFVAYSGVTAQGAVEGIECAWKPGVKGPEFNPDFSARYENNGPALWTRHIGKIWATTYAEKGDTPSNLSAVLDVFTSSGALTTQQCKVDSILDGVSACTPTTPIMDRPSAIETGTEGDQLCRGFVQGLADKGLLTNELYNAKAANDWLATKQNYLLQTPALGK